MNRRSFLTVSGLTALPAATLTPQAEGGAEQPARKQWQELRIYRVDSEQKAMALDTFLGDVAVPAYNRAGVSPVGAFRFASDVEQKGRTLKLGPHDVVLLLPYPDAGSGPRDISDWPSAPTRITSYGRLEGSGLLTQKPQADQRCTSLCGCAAPSCL